jgi:DNA helicase HerA-like ATPase
METKNNNYSDLFTAITDEIISNGGEWEDDANCVGAIGMTMFDLPNSEDNLITVLIPKNHIRDIGAHSIVEIRSRTTKNEGDGRIYRGIVVAGPFHEPDGIRGDSPMIVTTAINGALFMPNFHGKVQIELIGELLDGIIMPPRFRPLPNSPVFVLSREETAEVLKVNPAPGITLGMAIGHENIEVKIPSDTKAVLPRHIGILGTTGGGKSTTISGLMSQFQQKGIATIVIDTEGEYTHVGDPTTDPTMQKLLENRGIPAAGINNMRVLHLHGKDTRAKKGTNILPFTLNFSLLSPYAVADILGLNEAQVGRFFKAYDVAKLILKDVGIYPSQAEEREAIDLDEFETGWPKLTLSLFIDVVTMIRNTVGKKELAPYNPILKEHLNAKVRPRIHAVETNSESSWGALLSKLWQLARTNLFDNRDAQTIPYAELIQSGNLTIIDLSDSDSTIINNIVITDLLRGVQEAQETAYELAMSQDRSPTPVSIIIEEAHEFLSSDKIAKMANLFQQVARIARRGRKRWLGLIFVTQLPQHLPDEVLGLINSFILHKINDANVVSRLKRSIGGVDNNLWNRLPNLAPGQAIVSTPSLSRSMLVAIDPAPCKLLMVD